MNPSALSMGLLREGFQELLIEAEHVLAVQDLPWIHRDPYRCAEDCAFDRLLVAQSLRAGLLLLTLSLDDALLRRAREAALRENTSVNSLVREFLRGYVEARSRRLEALEAFEAVASTSQSASQAPWSRESLHANA